MELHTGKNLNKDLISVKIIAEPRRFSVETLGSSSSNYGSRSIEENRRSSLKQINIVPENGSKNGPKMVFRVPVEEPTPLAYRLSRNQETVKF
jgi:hypothetical protein